MYARSLIFGALAATSAAATEPAVFHTSRFPDAKTVDLSLLSNHLSHDVDYDFDVTIGLTELDGNGSLIYRDRGTHRARVRCNAPPKVLVGGTDYSIDLSVSSGGSDDWKRDLWRTMCTMPTS